MKNATSGDILYLQRTETDADRGMKFMEIYKRYVDVILMQKRSGDITPLYVVWENGQKYRIDKVLSRERRSSQVGGCGMRYVCLIQGNRRNLYLEKDKWFIESHQP